MLDTADVLVYRQPVVGGGRIQHALVVVGAAETGVVPGRLHEGVEGVGLQGGGLAVELGFAPLRVGLDGRLHAIHLDIFRQANRQLVVRNRHFGAVVQGHHRDGRAPVTLAGNTPVPQAVVNGALANVVGFQVAGDFLEGFIAGQAAVFAGAYQYTFFGIGLFLDIDIFVVARCNHLLDGQFVFAGKLVVTVIVARYGHQGAGAVVHQHKVGDPNRNLFLGQRVDGLETGINTFLFHGGHFGLSDLAVTALVDKLCHVAMALCRRLGQRMLGSDRHVAHAHQGVRAGGVNGQAVFTVFQGEGQLGTGGLADPVALHGLDLFRPAFQVVHVVQQFFRVVGDADEPLGNLFLLYQRAGAPAAAVNHLFVGQHGLVNRVPVNGGHLLVHQALLVQAGEEPLFPAVIFRVTGGQFTAPVVPETQLFELVFHVIDVGAGPLCRRGLIGNGGVFRRQAEGVPAHRLHHVLALHALVAGNHVADGVVANVAHVQLAAGVGEHGQAVVLGLARLFLHFEGFVGFPEVAGGLFYVTWVVLLVHSCHYQKYPVRKGCSKRPNILTHRRLNR